MCCVLAPRSRASSSFVVKPHTCLADSEAGSHRSCKRPELGFEAEGDTTVFIPIVDKRSTHTHTHTTHCVVRVSVHSVYLLATNINILIGNSENPLSPNDTSTSTVSALLQTVLSRQRQGGRLIGTETRFLTSSWMVTAINWAALAEMAVIVSLIRCGKYFQG